MSPEEFMQRLWKENRDGQKSGRVVDVVVAVIYAACIFVVSKDSTLPDTIIFAGLMAGLYNVYWKFIRSIFESDIDRMVLEECDRGEITILQYGEVPEQGMQTEENEEEKDN